MYYVTILSSLFMALLIACPESEPKQQTCKKMDQTGTTCLDGAQQVSQTTTSNNQQGMTTQQMLELMNAMQERRTQQVVVDPNATVGQVVAKNEAWYRSEKFRLETEIANSRDASQKRRLSSELAYVNEQLRGFEELKKEPEWWKQAGGAIFNDCIKEIGGCLKGAFNFSKDAYNAIKNLGSNDKPQRPEEWCTNMVNCDKER